MYSGCIGKNNFSTMQPLFVMARNAHEAEIIFWKYHKKRNLGTKIAIKSIAISYKFESPHKETCFPTIYVLPNGKFRSFYDCIEYEMLRNEATFLT